MRNEAMEHLDVLLGCWRTTMRNASSSAGRRQVPGAATVEWLGDAFVVFRGRWRRRRPRQCDGAGARPQRPARRLHGLLPR